MGVTGDRALINNLKRLANEPSIKEIDRISIDALEPLRSRTASLAPRASLQRGVVVRRKEARGRQHREYWVSFKRGLAMRIAHLVEFGTYPHSLARGSRRDKGIGQNRPPFHPGTPAHPFMTPAFESTKNDVLKRWADGVWTAISNVALRLGGN